MAEFRGDYTKLPPGWDCKYDQATGKCYYINYLTKAMQLEDPRIRYKQLQNEKCSMESIPMQPLHGSPYHVYPTSNFPAVKAFQGPNSQSVSASPLLSTKSQQMEMSPILRQSSTPQTPHMMNLSRRQTIQETSFTNPSDTDAIVAKINNMFPTASENHIRLLLKKYYNREAVVISALQVEKHPVTMPGPYATPPSQRHLYHSNSAFQMTPPSRRFDAMSSRNDSPIPGRPSSVTSGLYGSPRFGDQIRSSPKPHSSPKMKLRYLKSIFPKADETLLLDILANADNNVQKASEQLISMGYAKKEMANPPKISNRPQPSEYVKKRESAEEKIIPLHPKVISAEDKGQIKERLQNKYKTIEERIILMALESVNYSEDRASQILKIVLQEDETKAKKDNAQTDDKIENTIIEEEIQIIKQKSGLDETDKIISISANIINKISSTSSSATTATVSSSSSSLQPSQPQHQQQKISSKIEFVTPIMVSSTVHSLLDGEQIRIKDDNGYKISHTRDKRNSLKNSLKGSIEDEQHSIIKNEFKSIVSRITTKGHNSELTKGPDDTLLLADYITWNGANPDMTLNRKGLSVGSDPSLISERNYTPIGHDKNLCKGPKIGLIKGSIYSQINQNIIKNVKCN